ncbi:MAG: response regulator [Nitrospira sp.]|nr:response regulator [bacterium]MBL7049508.1 response regulator [Nitrospira sp.]
MQTITHSKILIAEDDAVSQQMLYLILKKMDYEVIRTDNGTSALEILSSDSPPQIAIIDWLMPGLNGIEVCEAIRSMGKEPYIYMILLSGKIEKEDIIEGISSGADDYITKPLNISELKVRLNAANRVIKLENILRNKSDVLLNQQYELEAAISNLQLAQSRIIHQEKMASVGQLAAGVAHEINNPVGYITSNLGTLREYGESLTEYITFLSDKFPVESASEIIEKYTKLDIKYILEDMGQLISESLNGAERVKKIVQNLKTFSRVDESDCQLSDINECIESTLDIIWNELKYKVDLKKEYGEIPRTMCYPQQLNQVFMNLLINAVQSIDNKGEIGIKTWSENNSINISITDTGSGIPPDKLQKVFEPFFTTKEPGKGTGLGLSICYEIIKKHKGEMTVQSEIGKGTVFTVQIPVMEESDSG